MVHLGSYVWFLKGKTKLTLCTGIYNHQQYVKYSDESF